MIAVGTNFLQHFHCFSFRIFRQKACMAFRRRSLHSPGPILYQACRPQLSALFNRKRDLSYLSRRADDPRWGPSRRRASIQTSQRRFRNSHDHFLSSPAFEELGHFTCPNCRTKRHVRLSITRRSFRYAC